MQNRLWIPFLALGWSLRKPGAVGISAEGFVHWCLITGRNMNDRKIVQLVIHVKGCLDYMSVLYPGIYHNLKLDSPFHVVLQSTLGL